MRIVVSGTHASGKSTLISDFHLRHPDFVVLPDAFEDAEDAGDAPSAALFAAQLRIAADRLVTDDAPDLIAERGPLDFLAYLFALAELSGVDADERVLERATALVTAAMQTVDALIVLPLSARNAIPLPSDEHPELREVMNDALLDLIDDAELIGAHVRIAEISGSPEERLMAMEEFLRGPAT
ncbi:AAA family ATPase [Microbacterium sp. RURRCA19A]|uniref:AAA family ATPase n=1 Tax=Microbacterium sp. RURRCA19A TaxID=1907391 RepID=UPI000954B311|nr:AAA family ATPase [Microbacterium sp. RURRCA19A]SIR65076.1 AAA domain-containing protein [Microbacterium sp. RURRCA19A]